MSKLSRHWQHVSKDYKLLEVLGEGTFGKVIQGQHRQTKQMVAIKFIPFDTTKSVQCRYIIRELSLLR